MNATRLHVVVLFGGRSGEHEVSLMSARSLLLVLDPRKYMITQVGITHEGAWLTGSDVLTAFEQGRVAGLSPVLVSPDPSNPGLFVVRNASGSEESLAKLPEVDVYFPVLHGTYGEDGTIQGLLELAGAAYVGAGVVGSAVGMDKGIFKDVMRAHGIPVIDACILTRSQLQQDMPAAAAAAEAVSDYPLFVKPANLGSSVGVTKCRTRGDLVEGLMEAAQYDRRVLVEKAVPHAREIEVSVLGNDAPVASLPGEIVPGADFYSYAAKYELDSSELVIPAVLEPAVTQRVRELALLAFQAVDACGMARVDFLMDGESGAVYLNEINTIPGFTRISMYPKLWQASGMSYAQLVDRLIELALERRRDNDRTLRQYRRSA